MYSTLKERTFGSSGSQQRGYINICVRGAPLRENRNENTISAVLCPDGASTLPSFSVQTITDDKRLDSNLRAQVSVRLLVGLTTVLTTVHQAP